MSETVIRAEQAKTEILLEGILTYLILSKLREPRIVKRIVRHVHAPAQAFRVTNLSAASIADLGTRDHDLLTGLGDDDHTQYVPVDGIARQLADAGYPNALLLDGTRPMISDLDFGAKDARSVDRLYFMGRGLGSENILLRELQGVGSTQLILRNAADTAYVDMRLDRLFTHYFEWTSLTQRMETNLGDYKHIAGNPQISCFEVNGTVAANPMANIPRAGDIIMLAAKSLDAYTNAGYMKPRRLSQSAEPTPQTGELLMWRDTDDDKTYLVYEDPDVGTRKIELA